MTVDLSERDNAVVVTVTDKDEGKSKYIPKRTRPKAKSRGSALLQQPIVRRRLRRTIVRSQRASYVELDPTEEPIVKHPKNKAKRNLFKTSLTLFAAVVAVGLLSGAAAAVPNITDAKAATLVDDVGNTPPTVDAGGFYSGDEAFAIALDKASASDADEDDLTYSWTVTDDDPVRDLCSFDNPTVRNPNLVCADNTTATATLTVGDGTYSVGSTATVTVNNVAPIVTAILVEPMDPVVPQDEPINVTAFYTDPSSVDVHMAEWDWGDDTTSGGTVDDDLDVVGPDRHTYTTPGVYAVQLTLTDDDSGSATDTYDQYVVVYDPSAGFVTGGGWIDSPAGACPVVCGDANATGEASFGFVSKYKKGQTTPDGNTQFQFNAGNLNFHSSSYQWLVVAGAKAKFKGDGTINGGGHYGFMLTALDADVNTNDSHGEDGFRIVIWDKDGGDVVVYDNLGSLDMIVEDDYGTQSLLGGSIAIHQAKGKK
jgi:hypothetical protein